VLLVNLAPHFPAYVRILSLSERFSLAFLFDRAVESMRFTHLGVLVRLYPPYSFALELGPDRQGTRAVRVCFDLELLFDLRCLAGRD
jgi:hypothetical protein